LCVYKQNHNNAELLNCLFKKIVTFMAWMLYEIVPSVYPVGLFLY
jgi:hypothetical protein